MSIAKRINTKDLIKPTTTTGISSPSLVDAQATTDNTAMWDMYRNQLAQANVNQKAELASINQKANSYVNNYLKALGLSGTSAGASQIATNNVNLMNAYSQANNDYQERLNEINENERAEIKTQEKEAQDALTQQKNTYGAYLTSALETAAKNGATSKRMNEIMDMYDDENLPEGLKQSLMAAYGDALKWETDRDTVLKGMQGSIEDVYDELTTNQLNNLENIMDKLSDAKTEEEYDSLYEQYKKIIQNPKKADNSSSTTGTTTTSVANTEPVKSGSGTVDFNSPINPMNNTNNAISGISTSADETAFGSFVGTNDKTSTQSVWVNVLQQAARNGDIPDGTVVDMNVGWRTGGSKYMYDNGKWYPVADNKKVDYQIEAYFNGDYPTQIKNALKKITGKDYYDEIIESLRNPSSKSVSNDSKNKVSKK